MYRAIPKTPNLPSAKPSATAASASAASASAASASVAPPRKDWNCGECTFQNEYYRQFCIMCRTSKTHGPKPLETEKWTCYHCKKENNTLFNEKCTTEACLNKVKVKLVDNVFFQPQSRPMSCLREAINNVMQRVAVVNDSSATFTIKDYQTEKSPINLGKMCDVLKSIFRDGMEECSIDENYDVTVLYGALNYLGYRKSEELGRIQIQTLNDTMFDNESFLFININSGSCGHWISARYINDKWYLFDGQYPEPFSFTPLHI